jgi:hypothetical protein
LARFREARSGQHGSAGITTPGARVGMGRAEGAKPWEGGGGFVRRYRASVDPS